MNTHINPHTHKSTTATLRAASFDINLKYVSKVYIYINIIDFDTLSACNITNLFRRNIKSRSQSGIVDDNLGYIPMNCPVNIGR